MMRLNVRSIMKSSHHKSWAAEEFSEADLGDKRLNRKLVELSNCFSEAPQSPINQACSDWAETKAAYRFFENDKVKVNSILQAHCEKTALRASQYETILVLQDTTYINYTSHPKTTGLGEISKKNGKHVDKIYAYGLSMHTSLAVTTKGLPLGLLANDINARKGSSLSARERAHLPIEEKESFRWLESLSKTHELTDKTNRAVTVCDRESDIYDFFKLSNELQAPVLVRATADRTINRKSRYAQKDVIKLWDYMNGLAESGTFEVEIPRRSKSKHNSERPSRTAVLSVRFGSFMMNAPRNHPSHGSEVLPDIAMTAIYVTEVNPTDSEPPVEWMLLTNLPVECYEQACEKIQWYSLRWRIEMFFKIIKSGFRVEECRLATAQKLMRYLTIISIVAWRLFTISLIARTAPEQCASSLLKAEEWKILFLKTNRRQPLPDKPPKLKEAIRMIAKLGGHLGRKCDGPPGTLTLWRGWKRLVDICQGADLASQIRNTCG